MPVELVQSWLAESSDVRFVTERVNPVYLSQHGFQNLRDGACDLACVDRTIGTTERPEFAAPPQAWRIAYYGFGLYVHPDNPTDSIYAGHFKSLLRGTMTDWKEVGPWEGKVRVLGPRKSTRGGQALMQQAQIWFADPTWEALESDAEIIREVAADPTALGFASIGYDRDVRYLGLRMERNGRPAFPSIEEIERDDYGLAKLIYLYAASPPSPGVDAAVKFLQSEAGHEAIRRTGLRPISAERAVLRPSR